MYLQRCRSFLYRRTRSCSEAWTNTLPTSFSINIQIRVKFLLSVNTLNVKTVWHTIWSFLFCRNPSNNIMVPSADITVKFTVAVLSLPVCGSSSSSYGMRATSQPHHLLTSLFTGFTEVPVVHIISWSGITCPLLTLGLLILFFLRTHSDISGCKCHLLQIFKKHFSNVAFKLVDVWPNDTIIFVPGFFTLNAGKQEWKGFL